jgi:hypothetical protein
MDLLECFVRGDGPPSTTTGSPSVLAVASRTGETRRMWCSFATVATLIRPRIIFLARNPNYPYVVVNDPGDPALARSAGQETRDQLSEFHWLLHLGHMTAMLITRFIGR